MIARVTCIVLAGAALTFAQEAKEDLVPYQPQEVENLINTFLQIYKNKKSPEEDAVATLANLKNAYRYLDSRGEERTKEEEKLQKKVLSVISKKGLFARDRPLVNLECARILGELENEDATNDLRKWLERVLDEKNPNPQWVEYGFQSLAWIGSSDRRALELAVDYATKGKHSDTGVAAQAIKACYEWKSFDASMREEIFKKIHGYLQGLYSKAHGSDPKLRGTYEQRYNAVKDEGLKALAELAGDGSKFADPNAANEWLKENKRRKWEDYTGPRFRTQKTEEKKDAEKS